ncbi:hypothetical protein [Pulveribacter sp.]|uniref:hypothetical protein n=1 Tax=Pulveribacter sp. TaxID=2678893 RepID=UPI0028AFBB62|nr:hypothetical protein [Pulveribacter sp.]
MDKQKIGKKLVTLAAGGTAIWLCLQIILIFGIEKKSIFQIFSDILGGGAIGATAGILFFIFFGSIGWVSGAIYGAIGLFSLALGGALGGLGLGSLIHIVRNPGHYNFNIPVIVVGIVLTFLIYKFVTAKVGNLYDKHGPEIAKWCMEKMGK